MPPSTTMLAVGVAGAKPSVESELTNWSVPLETVVAFAPVRLSVPAFAPESCSTPKPALVNEPEPMIAPLRVWALLVVPERAVAVNVREADEPKSMLPESVKVEAPHCPMIRFEAEEPSRIGFVAVTPVDALREVLLPLTWRTPTPRPAALPRMMPPC